MSKFKHKNFKALEDSLTESLLDCLSDSSQENRARFFSLTKEAAFAILSSGPQWKGLDFDRISYEYALYLFERVITGSFKPQYEGRLPWGAYIAQSIKHVINKQRNEENWSTVVEDVQTILDANSTSVNGDLGLPKNDLERITSRTFLSYKLLESLRIFYSEDEIKRLYPLSMDILSSSTASSLDYLVSKSAPSDVQDFLAVLISMSKRLVSIHNIAQGSEVSLSKMKKAIDISVRSTVFLSSVVNSDFFSRDLLLALDIDSLYRLIYIAGGTEIRIPTLRELDSLLGAVLTVSGVVLGDEEAKKTLNKSRRDFELVFSKKINMDSFVSNMLQSFDLFREEEGSDSLMNLVLVGMESLERVSAQLVDKLEKQPSAHLLSYFKELSASIDAITNTLTHMKNHVSSK